MNAAEHRLRMLYKGTTMTRIRFGYTPYHPIHLALLLATMVVAVLADPQGLAMTAQDDKQAGGDGAMWPRKILSELTRESSPFLLRWGRLR